VQIADCDTSPVFTSGSTCLWTLKHIWGSCFAGRLREQLYLRPFGRLKWCLKACHTEARTWIWETCAFWPPPMRQWVHWSEPLTLGLCGALCCCGPVCLATTAAHASPPYVGPRLLEAWTVRLLSVATAGLPPLLWLVGRACKSGRANDYRLVAADVWKGPFLNMWDVPTWELYAQCDQTKCDRYRGITLFKSYIQSTIKYIDRIWRKIIGDRYRMIKNYNYNEYPENLDYNNGTQRPSGKSSYREQHVTKFFFLC